MYKSVLIPFDIHDSGDCARIITTVAELLSRQDCIVHLLNVLPEDEGVGWAKQFIPDGFTDHLREQAGAKLEDLATRLNSVGLQTSTLVVCGNTYVETLAAAEARKAELIVIGAGRVVLKDFLLGPSASRIVRHAECSVLVVRS